MDSLYATYLKERTYDHILEKEYGFATYRYVNEGSIVYIIDIFIEKMKRQEGLASKLADEIVEEAKKKGCTQLIGTVMPSVKNSTTSLKVLLAYGMILDSASNNAIVLRKEI